MQRPNESLAARRNVFVLLFLGVWVGLWAIGEASALTWLERGGRYESAFTAIWLVAWTVVGVLVNRPRSTAMASIA